MENDKKYRVYFLEDKIVGCKPYQSRQRFLSRITVDELSEAENLEIYFIADEKGDIIVDNREKYGFGGNS